MFEVNRPFSRSKGIKLLPFNGGIDALSAQLKTYLSFSASSWPTVRASRSAAAYCTLRSLTGNRFRHYIRDV